MEHPRAELRKAEKPDRTDDRAFLLNLVMNGLAKEGYEFAGMSIDEIVMKRPVAWLWPTGTSLLPLVTQPGCRWDEIRRCAKRVALR